MRACHNPIAESPGAEGSLGFTNVAGGRWAGRLWANQLCGGMLGLTVLLAMPTFVRAESPASPPSERFTLMPGGEAVKDTKTGLIWEQSPDSFHGVWSEAASHCLEKTVGSLRGWRIPTVQELSSLIDTTQRDPALPQGHPFSNIKSATYWTATPSATDDIVAYQVSFFTGEVATDQKSQTRRAWCVLGGIDKPAAR
ncbi:MAG: DUF1566 domain-containing protein [Nitrospirae bacterium]|nr:DUF1566 domain-containing protein [Nitrospirota bacterium]